MIPTPMACRAVLRVVLATATIQPGTTPVDHAASDSAPSEQLAQLDRHAQTIVDLTADFVEEKYTTLLKKPLISRGRVYVKGKRTRWQTTSPRESTLFTDESQVAIYYPSRATMEVYPVDQRLRALLVSPVPRVATLRKHFDIAVAPTTSAETRNLRLTPTDDALRDFVEELRVTVDLHLGIAIRIEMVDPEGDRTVITFMNVRTNAGLTEEDVARRVPPNTKIVRPLDPDAESRDAPPVIQP